jgi:anti-sigma regulatory factor (Ser/Thr protein kinase)
MTGVDADEATGGLHARACFPAEPAAAGEARRWLRGVLATEGREHLTDTGELLLTELVGNAVQHAQGPVLEVTIDCDDVLRAAVHDGEPSLPQLRRAGPMETCGRGLALVHELSNRWGATLFRAGKFVWFELVDDRARYDTAVPSSTPAT